jgi:diadenylate cyclase
MHVSFLRGFWHNWAQWLTGGDAWSLVRTGADILIVAYLVYRLIMLAKGTRAWQIITGLVVFVAMLLFSTWARLSALSWILQQILPLGPVAIVILFFPELRHALEEVGRLGFWGKGFTGLDREDLSSMVGEIVKATESLSDKKIGALLVLERETGLSDIIETGTLLNSEVSADLLCTLFYPGSPLHDGAVVIRRDRIVAAGCTLPLSESRVVQGMQVHTRHKAALGITEQSDALVVVVSEETGIISLAFDGKMARGLRDDGRLHDLLIREYTGREKPSLRRRRGFIRPRSAKSDVPTPTAVRLPETTPLPENTPISEPAAAGEPKF